MKKNLGNPSHHHETSSQEMARNVMTPEYLSAAVLSVIQGADNFKFVEMATELSRQTTAVNKGDMARVEDMLLAQAHTLDGLFASLTTKAFKAQHLDVLEQYLRLALKAQNQARATLQTLAELKSPKQLAFVQQANIGNQIQVNNGDTALRTRTRKNKKTPSKLLDSEHFDQLKTSAPSSAIGAKLPTMPRGEKERAKS